MTKRNQLIKELKSVAPTYDGQDFIDAIADFIIEDRKRIVAPLSGIDEKDLTKAEKQVLRNAGLDRGIKKKILNCGCYADSLCDCPENYS